MYKNVHQLNTDTIIKKIICKKAPECMLKMYVSRRIRVFNMNS